MSGSVKSRRNHTLLCLMAVYGFHGILFHVLSSPPVLLTSVIVKTSYLKNIISRSRTSSHTSFYNQSFPAVNDTKKNVSVHLSVIYHTNIIRNNVDAWIRNKSDSSPSELPLKENLYLEKRGNAFKDSSAPADDFLNLISWSGSLYIINLVFLEVKVVKILSPSDWGVFIGCLVFLFTSPDCERESTSR